MADGDDYESLPETATPVHHMIAGAAAGIMEHCIIYPVDVVKTRMMCLNPSPNAQYNGIMHALAKIVKEEGAFRPVRGMSVVAFGAGPAHALYFSCYEFIKKHFSGKSNPGDNPLTNAVAGCFSTLLHDAVMVPSDVIKQRMQMYHSPYKGFSDCVKTIFRYEGIRAFYKSYFTQVAMNIPFQCTHLVTYDFLQSILNPKREYSPLTHSISGACAGALAAAITTPLDVCKTLINTQECCSPEDPCPVKAARIKQIIEEKQLPKFANNLKDAVRIIYHTGGATAFFKGIAPRTIFQIPGTAVSWSVYEFFKHYFINRDQQQVDQLINNK